MRLKFEEKIIEDDGNVVILPFSPVNAIEKYESYNSLRIDANETKVIASNGLKSINSVNITSENTVLLETYEGDQWKQIGRGKNIFMDGLNATSLRITNLYKDLSHGVVSDFSSGETKDSLEASNHDGSLKNYTYSKLIGTKVSPDYSPSPRGLFISIYGHSEIYVKTSELSFSSSMTQTERAQAIATEIVEAIKYAFKMDPLLCVFNVSESRFELIAKEAGAHQIDIVNYQGKTNEVTLGFFDYTFDPGTEDYSGKKIEMLSGLANQESKEIESISHENIGLSSKFSGTVVPGDRYHIIDDTAAADISIAMFEYKE